jgi:outer membrane lipoprotein-sorting protein
MNRLGTSLLAAALFCGLAVPARAAEPAEKLTATQILEKMEARNNGFADQTMEVTLTVIDAAGSKKAYDFVTRQKGDIKRLVQFTSGELKGMATLVESETSVYVYLPGFKKVRRVAASNMNQKLAGSDLSSEDMANVSWVKGWNCKLQKEDETSWWLELTPKQGQESQYAKVVHRVAKGHFSQQESHYFNAAGEEVKQFMNSDLHDFDGVTRYRSIVVSDPRAKSRSELFVRAFKVNQGLQDSLFTVRTLQFGK